MKCWNVVGKQTPNLGTTKAGAEEKELRSGDPALSRVNQDNDVVREEGREKQEISYFSRRYTFATPRDPVTCASTDQTKPTRRTRGGVLKYASNDSFISYLFSINLYLHSFYSLT